MRLWRRPNIALGEADPPTPSFRVWSEGEKADARDASRARSLRCQFGTLKNFELLPTRQPELSQVVDFDDAEADSAVLPGENRGEWPRR
jgi:hypothetical protein